MAPALRMTGKGEKQKQQLPQGRAMPAPAAFEKSARYDKQKKGGTHRAALLWLPWRGIGTDWFQSYALRPDCASKYFHPWILNVT